MQRRHFLALAAPAALLLAACGGDDATPAGSPVSTAATVPGTDAVTVPGTEAPAGIQHPTGAEDVVMRLGYEGGFVPPGTNFVNMPTSLITGDGLLITPGAMTMQYPGPLVKPLFQQTITEDGIQIVLQRAQDDQLLQEPPKYARNDMIADAADTVVILGANGETYRHQAYALGLDTETDPARQRLADFATAAGDVPGMVGEENLGEPQPFVPTAYRIMAMPTTLDQWAGNEVEPTVEQWPADAGVSLADASECALLDASIGTPLFQDATDLTFFEDGGELYQVFVAAELPGDAACG